VIGEEVLERGLRTAADDYDVPAAAVDAIRAELTAMTAASEGAAGGARRLRPRGPRSWKGWTAALAAAAGLIVGVPLALGGSGGSGGSGGTSANSNGAAAGASAVHGSVSRPGKFLANLPGRVASGAASAANGSVAGGSGAAPRRPLQSQNQPNGPDLVPNGVPDRVVKTGNLRLRVPKGQVAPSLQRLSALASRDGGYVQSSDQQTGGAAPSGEITLRIPVSRFADAVNQATKLSGAKVLSLQTSGQDVTSHYVDLSARITALQRVRATYLTLLGHATTIGETLEVQDRIANVQSQIEQLQGQRKLLASQAALSTLTVSVDQPVRRAVARHHQRSSGFGHAVHVSVSRFVRGVEAIVSVLGPLLLAAILVGIAVVIGRFGYRRLRRYLV